MKTQEAAWQLFFKAPSGACQCNLGSSCGSFGFSLSLSLSLSSTGICLLLLVALCLRAFVLTSSHYVAVLEASLVLFFLLAVF